MEYRKRIISLLLLALNIFFYPVIKFRHRLQGFFHSLKSKQIPKNKIALYWTKPLNALNDKCKELARCVKAKKRKIPQQNFHPEKLLRFRVAKNVKALEKQRVIEKSEWLKIAEINFYFAVPWDIWRWNFFAALFERRFAQRNIKIHVQQLFFSCFSHSLPRFIASRAFFFRSFVIDPAKSFVKLLKLWVVLFSTPNCWRNFFLSPQT